MLAYIRSNYKIGDPVSINCSEGTISGEIEFVSNKYIVLRQPNGQIAGIAAADVRSFSAACPVPLSPAEKPATKAPAETDEEEAQGEGEGNDAHAAAEFSPKVIGKINLEQIDPRYARRHYFRGEDSEGEAARNGQEEGGQGKPYVAARGRITFYNTEKRYGFIHDFLEDCDIYFHQTQVVDSALYDELFKGTKVAYTLGKNSQGPCAYCLHLPCEAESLLPVAEDFFDARRYQQAQSLLQQVLEADPANTEAKNLLEDIRAVIPAAHAAEGSLYVPSPLYSQAKKLYLAKQTDEAEEAYLKAIAAGERVESCVKDLVTLYVSKYKQAEEAEEKAACKKKAMDFLESHRDCLTDNLTTRQFLALNYYLSLQEYDSFLVVVDEILADPAILRISSKRTFYMWQKAIVLNKLGRRDEALALVPAHHQLRRLQQYILNPVTDATDATGQEGGAPAGETEDGEAEQEDGKEQGGKDGSWWQQSLDTGW